MFVQSSTGGHVYPLTWSDFKDAWKLVWSGVGTTKNPVATGTSRTSVNHPSGYHQVQAVKEGLQPDADKAKLVDDVVLELVLVSAIF